MTIKGYEDADWKAAATDEGTFSPTQLFTAEDERKTGQAMVAEGLVLAVGTIIAFNAAGEIIQWNPEDATNLPDSLDEVPVGVLAASVDTYDGPQVMAPFWEGGCFNPDLLIWPAVLTTFAERNSALRASGAPFRVKRLL